MTLHSSANRQKIQRLLKNACELERLPLVHKRLAQGADPSASDINQQTPLMHAAGIGNASLIDLFLPFNDIAAVDSLGRTPLSHLTSFFSLESIPAHADWRRLLRPLLSQKTANGLGEPPICQATRFWHSFNPKFGEFIAELAPFCDFSTFSAPRHPLYAAIDNRICSDSDILDLLSRVSILLPRDRQILTHLAAFRNVPNFLSAIHSANGSVADMELRDDRGRTPLMSAAIGSLFHGPESLRLLLAQGCDPNAVDYDGCTALMLAIEGFHFAPANHRLFRNLEVLVERSNLCAVDALGESAWEKAIDHEPEVLAPFIREQMGSSSSSLPRPHQQPNAEKLDELVAFAITNHKIDLFNKRLAQGASTSTRSSTNSTLLMKAAASGFLAGVLRLAPFSNLADIDADGNTALMAFLLKKKIDDSRYISVLAALASPESVAMPNHAGNTPLMTVRASPSLWPEVIAILGPASNWKALNAKGDNLISCRIAHSPPCNLPLWDAHPDQAWLASSTNHAGESLAHFAARTGDLELLDSFITPALLSLRDATGRTPLMSAAEISIRGFYAIECPAAVAERLAPLSDCTAVDANGCDALMLVIENPSRSHRHDLLPIIGALIGRADLSSRDFLGESAWEKAVDLGLLDAANLIRERMAIFEERDALGESSPKPAPGAKPSPRI